MALAVAAVALATVIGPGAVGSATVLPGTRGEGSLLMAGREALGYNFEIGPRGAVFQESYADAGLSYVHHRLSFVIP